MYKDRYKVLGSPKKKQFIENNRESSKELLSKLSASPAKKHHSPQTHRKNNFQQQRFQQNNRIQPENGQYQLNCETDARLSALIYEAISSADRVIKPILKYDVPELQELCSRYFLNKEKLYLYLHSETIAAYSPKSKFSKMTNFKPRKDLNSSEDKEEVSLKQLKKLENIVSNKIIPLLKQQLYKEKKKYSKIKKQMSVLNPEQREELYLLQRLSQKGKKLNFDDYIEVLQKYILKVMDKQNGLKDRLEQLQEKLEKQTQRVEEYQNFIKKREEEKHQDDIQRANELKRMVRYEQFAKNIQSMMKDEEQDYFVKETQNLDSLAERIRKIWKQHQSLKKEKGPIHKQKSLQQSQSDSQSNPNEKLKHLKEVVKTLNKQIGTLKYECQHLQDKFRNSKEEIAIIEKKQKKLIAENESSKYQIQKLTEEIRERDRQLENYLSVVGKYEQELKQSYENVDRLQWQKEKHHEEIKRQQEEHEKLLKHIIDIEDRYRELCESEDKKQKDNEDLNQHVQSNEAQIKQLNQKLENYEKQLRVINSVLIQREEMILQLQQKNKVAEEKLYQLANKTAIQKNVGPSATVIDSQFIDKSEPNHQRQDFIPGKRLKGDVKQSIKQPQNNVQKLQSPQNQHNHESLSNTENKQANEIADVQNANKNQKAQNQEAKKSIVEDKDKNQIPMTTAQKIDAGVQTKNLFYFQNFESQVFRYLPDIKRILSKQSFGNREINQSLIEEIELLNGVKRNQSLQTQQLNSLLQERDKDQYASSPIPSQEQSAQNYQCMKKARHDKLKNSFTDLGELMNYHKEKYLSLQMLVKKTTSQSIKLQEKLQTPVKTPLLQSQQFIEQINQAPERQKQQFQLEEEEEAVMKKLENGQLNESPLSKSQAYELLILQTMEQNAKLKQFIQELTNRQKENQKVHAQEYKGLQDKFKQLLARKQELQRELDSLKSKKQEPYKGLQHDTIGQNQRQTAKNPDKSQKVVKNSLEQQLSNNRQQVKQDHHNAEQNKKKALDQNANSQSNKIREANSSSQMDFTWKDLIPEYFGDRQGRGKQQK